MKGKQKYIFFSSLLSSSSISNRKNERSNSAVFNFRSVQKTLIVDETVNYRPFVVDGCVVEGGGIQNFDWNGQNFA